MPEQRPDAPRDDYAGPEHGPEPPYPIRLQGPVIKGFGRGSRELGIPTANIPPSGLDAYPDLKSGVYFGFVGLKITPETTQPADNSALTLSSSSQQQQHSATTGIDQPNGAENGGVGVYPAVLSIGYNPFYKNTTRSIEIHILHPFPTYNFYHSPLNLLILGFIRPEYDYNSLEALVEDIKMDCEVARRSLARMGYVGFGGGRGDEGEKEEARKEGSKWLRDFEWWKGVGEEEVRKLEERETGKSQGQGEGESGKL